jgi:hypothetical protein
VSSYPAPPFDALTSFGMLLIVATVAPAAAWVFAGGEKRATRPWLAALAAVMLLSAALATTGLLARADIKPPLLQVLIISVLSLLMWRGFSHSGRQAAQRMSVTALVLLQSFRLPLEMLMRHAADVGVMPIEFSMAGYNFDVITGALALPLGLALWRGKRLPPALIWGWNFIGMACLCVIVVLAVLTSPHIAFFGSDSAHLSVWVLHLPYVWLPTILVSVAIYGHLALSSRLLQGPAAQAQRQAYGLR